MVRRGSLSNYSFASGTHETQTKEKFLRFFHPEATLVPLALLHVVSDSFYVIK